MKKYLFLLVALVMSVCTASAYSHVKLTFSDIASNGATVSVVDEAGNAIPGASATLESIGAGSGTGAASSQSLKTGGLVPTWHILSPGYNNQANGWWELTFKISGIESFSFSQIDADVHAVNASGGPQTSDSKTWKINYYTGANTDELSAWGESATEELVVGYYNGTTCHHVMETTASSTTISGDTYLRIRLTKVTGGGCHSGITTLDLHAASAKATVTYVYKHNGTEFDRYESEQNVGDVVATPTAKAFVNLSYDATTTVAAEGTTVEIDCTSNVPFTVTTDPSAPVTGLLRGQSNFGVYAYINSEGNGKMSGTLPTDVPQNYFWYITGNVFDGFQLFNLESGMPLKATAGSGDTTIDDDATADENNLWYIDEGLAGSVITANFFAMKTNINVTDKPYLNSRSSNTKLGYWSSHDAGSTFTFIPQEYVAPTDDDYTINIVGNAAGAVTYTVDGVEYGDGEPVTITGTPVASQFTPATIEFYTSTVEVDVENKTITVTYTEDRSEQMAALLAEAQAEYDLNSTYVEGEDVIKAVSQLSSPYTETPQREPGSGIDKLIDNNVGTYWHTSWAATVPNHTHYLQVDATEEIQGTVKVTMSRRNNADNDHCVLMGVMACNEADGEYVNIGQMEFPYGGRGETLTNSFYLTTGYRYFRFYNDDSNGSTDRGYWHMSEFQLNVLALDPTCPNAKKPEVAEDMAQALATAAAVATPKLADVQALQNALNTYKDAMGLPEFTVTIVGAPEGTKVEFDGQQLASGDTFQAEASSVTEDAFTAPTVAQCYDAVVTIEGFNVTVTYIAWPTYTVKVVNNAEGGVTFDSQNYTNNQTFVAETVDGVVEATSVEGYASRVQVADNTITVCYMPVGAAFADGEKTAVVGTREEAAIVPGKWYVMTQIRGGETPVYDRGAGQNMYREAAANTVETLFPGTASEKTQYLLRFFETSVEGAYTIQFANGNYWNGVNTSASAADARYYFVHTATETQAGAPSTNGWAIINTPNLETFGSRVDNNAAGGTMAYWESGDFTSGTNNVFYLYNVDLVTEIQYTVNINNETATVEINGETLGNGETYTTTTPVAVADVHASTVAEHSVSVEINGYDINVTYTHWPVYTVHVSGHAEGGVTYDGVNYQNDATFTVESFDGDLFEVINVEGYDVDVDIDGTVITVTYSVHRNHFPTADTYYVTIENHETSRKPFLYNDITYSDDITLQAANLDNKTNGYVWKITSDGEGNMTVINAESGKGIKPAGGKASSDITAFQYTNGVNAGFFNMLSSQISGGGHDRLNCANSNDYHNEAGLRAVTTWTGAHGDNDWKFNEIDVTGLNEFTVEVNGAEGYVTYGTDKAANGGFFLAAAITKEELTASSVEGYAADITVAGNTITVTYSLTATPVNVTYNIYADGTLVDTKVVEEFDGYPTTFALENVPSYVTVTGIPATVSATTVDVITTTDFSQLPFTAGADHFYTLKEKRNATGLSIYVDPSDETSLKTVQGPTVNVENQNYFQWSFVGNWYTGYALLNKQTQSYVTYNSVNPTDNYHAVLTETPAEGAYFDLVQNGGENYLKIHGTTNNAYISNYGGITTTYLTNWNSSNNIGDDGAKIAIAEAVQLTYADQYVAALNAAQTELTGAANIPALYSTQAIADAQTAAEAITFDGNDQASVEQAISELDGVMDTFRATAVGSQVAFLSKSSFSTRGADYYLTAGNTNSDRMTAELTMQPGSVFVVESYDTESNGYTVKSLFTENYLPTLGNGGNAIYTNATASHYTFAAQGEEENRVIFQNTESPVSDSRGGLHIDAQKKIVVWGASGLATQWVLMPVTDADYNDLLNLDVTISQVGYTTLYCDYALEVPAGVKAYAVTFNEETGNLTPAELTEGEIPANTGVVVKGDASTTAKFTRVATTEVSANSDLQGVCQAANAANYGDNIYVLSATKVGEGVYGNVGFYKFVGSLLAAYKAFFIPSNGAEVRSFALDFGTEGIIDITTGERVEGSFDLQGRYMGKNVKSGLYIMNGKKTLKK